MKNGSPKTNLSFLYGLTFLSPVVYSVAVMELDSLQKIFFLCTSILVYIFIIYKFDSTRFLYLDRKLVITLLVIPFTFITAFFNGSESALILQLSNLLIPLLILLLAAIMLSILGERPVFKTVSRSVVIISTIFSFIGLLEVFEIGDIPLPEIIIPGSTLGHRGFASEYLSTSLPFFLIFNNFIKKEYKPVLFSAGFITLSFLFFTRSRSALVIVGIILLVCLIFWFREKKNGAVRRTIPVISVIIIAFAFSLIPVKGAERQDFGSVAASYLDTDFKSNKLRLNFWEASLQMIMEKPLVGIGLHKWSGYYPGYFGETFNDDNVAYVHNIHAHNDYLELFAESGISALLIYLLVLLIISRSLLRKSRKNDNYFYILLVVLVLALYSLLSFPLHKFSSYFLFAVSAGLALLSDGEVKKNFVKIKFGVVKIAFLIIFVLGLITSYIRLKSEINYIEAINYKNQKAYTLMLDKLDEVSALLYPYDPSKQPIDYYRGIARYYLGSYSENLSSILRANKLAPFNPLILNNVGAAYDVIGDKEKALKEYENLRLLFPNYIKPQISLLRVYAELDDADKGKILLDELKMRAPENPYLIQVENQYYNSK